MEPFTLEPENYIAIQKLLVSLTLGLFIGFLRRRRAAGIRTFTLICLGCTLFTIVSMDPILGANADKGRIVSNIVTGIGFLGMGVIWKYEDKIMGLTTAAAVWITAAIGIEVGIGNYFIALISTAIVGLVLISKYLPQKEKVIEKKLKTKIAKTIMKIK